VLRPALQTAYKFRDADRPLNVVLLSDGMTEPREQAELVRLIEQAPENVRVFCVGIGNEVNRPLLKQLAEGAGGLAAFVSQEDDFARQAQMFRRKLMRPAAIDVKIDIEGADVFDVTPRELPDLFHGAPLRIYGRYRRPGSAKVTVSATILGQPMNQSLDVTLPEQDDRNPEIERMWAYEQVQQKMAEIRRSGETPQLAADIVSLCEGYSIVSEYASFLVLENDSEFQRWQIARRNATRFQRDDAARVRLAQQLESLRDAALARTGPAPGAPVGTETQAATDAAAVPTGGAPDAATQAAAPVAVQPGDLVWSNSPNPPQASRTQFASTPGNGGGGSGVRFGGGGAIDPLSALAALGFAGAAWAARRRGVRGSTKN